MLVTSLHRTVNMSCLVARRLVPRCTLSTQSTKSEPFYGAPRPPSSNFKETNDFSSSQQHHLDGILSRMSLAWDSATTALKDPARADAVAILGEVTGHVALSEIRQRMENDPIGSQILIDQPLVSKETLPIDQLIASAENITADTPDEITFGQAYGRFLGKHHFDPNDRDPVKYITDPTLAYIMTRYRQSHDYWHALTELPPTVLGELGLKYLELLQMGLPVAALSVTVGSLKLSPQQRQVLHEVYVPWAIRQSEQASYLMNVYYEKEFETPLSHLRERLNLEPVPKEI